MSQTNVACELTPPLGDGSPFNHREKMRILRVLERKVLWLSAWIVHYANHIRPAHDRLKVGGHQASSASVVTLMTALYFDVLRPQDRVAVKPHASPVFHAIQYLLGRQSRTRLERFRALGGAQAYPSRTKDTDEVDISTGSVGLGAAMTVFSSLIQDYLTVNDMLDSSQTPGRMVALVGDAELDEGSIFESLFEGWKHDLRNVWWVVDYNRQSLDLVVEDHLVERVRQLFRLVDWDVAVLKYGKLLEGAFDQQGGGALRDWIDNCPNSLYSALVYRGGAAWREQLRSDLGDTRGIRSLLDQYDDDGLQELMTNLAGHDLETVLEAFHQVEDDRPKAFVAYTIKGFGLPLAGHKDNHAGQLSPAKIDQLRRRMNIAEGAEWDPFAGCPIPAAEIEAFFAHVPFTKCGSRIYHAATLPIPEEVTVPISTPSSTQTAFGRFLNELARLDHPLVRHLVTASPDVASSTNLGPWITKRGIFNQKDQRNFFAEQKVSSALPWNTGPHGQHFELGITETDLFLLLGAAGLADRHFGQRLIPIGTLYDPFIRRGLDAMNYACYQEARFIVVGTPSGISLAPEGGAHQSIFTPLIGMGQSGLTYFEPAYADELREIMLWSFNYLQAKDGGSVYLRLSTRKIEQLQREMTVDLRQAILEGGYWHVPPSHKTKQAIVCMGAIVPTALTAYEQLREAGDEPAVLIVTSPDRLASNWHCALANSHAGSLISQLPANAELTTVLDGHPLTLAWLGSVAGHRVRPLGVTQFGSSGSLSDVYHSQAIDEESISHCAQR